MSSQNTQKSCFLSLFQSVYTEYKQYYQLNKQTLPSISSLNSKLKRSEKTRSKSRKSRSRRKSPKRVRERVMEGRLGLRGRRDTEGDGGFVELEKEPLWHPKKRNIQRKEKIKRQPEIKESTTRRTEKIKTTDPLYQFYSQPASNQVIEQLPIPQTTNHPQLQPQPLPQSLPQPLPQPARQPIPQPTPISPKTQPQLLNFHPTKQQSSLLSIQTLIDQYFLFKKTMRSVNTQTKFTQLAKYIRDIKGYYFNIQVMNQIVVINPNLYKVVAVNGEKFVKCLGLTREGIGRRLVQTKLGMVGRGRRKGSDDDDEIQ